MIEEATSSKHSGTTDAPLVSVVAPCFNAEKYLEEALRSIYEQDYPNFEVIIVDDGSTDNSYAMLEQLQKVHGFQLYRQQNQGVSAALNFGLQHARGDYVATPDLDDIMLPHSLSVRAAYLDQHPEVGCVGALVIYIDSEGQETKRQNGNRIRQLDFDYLLGNAYVCGAPVSLYRMEALRAAGFYDPEIKVQDFQMTLRIASQGYQIHKLPVLVTRYRRHPDNLSRRYKVLLDADLRTIAPYQSHPAYERGRTELVNKALKYAVVADKRHAWQLLRSLPLRQWNRTTFRRLKRFLLHHEAESVTAKIRRAWAIPPRYTLVSNCRPTTGRPAA